jgi:DNA processing protein
MNFNEKYLSAVHAGLFLTIKRFEIINNYFQGDFERVFNANLPELLKSGLDEKAVTKFLARRSKLNPDKIAELLSSQQVKIITYYDENYPENLKNIYNPPAILFVKGEIKSEDFPCIAVVGSRNISSYGKRALQKIIEEIAKQKITIVSGLAYGVDILSHKVAIESGARTIAVLGNAIDKYYPAQHQNFAKKLVAENKGVVISEYPPNYPTLAENFPQRNRIVAGLAKAVIVIEAAEKSGTLITAKLANEMNKDLFAVPGEIFVKNSTGCNQLILDGMACPAISGKQILAQLGLKKITSQKAAQQNIPQVGVESEILKLLGNKQQHIDDLIRNSDLPKQTVLSTIVLLEIKGLILNLGNQIFVKNY